MPSALVPLANLTLGSAASTVTFSSISGAYRDLMLVTSTSPASGTQLVSIRFNSDSGANYNYVYVEGNGTSVVSASGTGQAQLYLDAGGYGATTAGNPYNGITHILDYSATDKHKSVLIRADIPSSATAATAGRWANTAAITTVTVIAGLNNFVAGNTFALYGIASA